LPFLKIAALKARVYFGNKVSLVARTPFETNYVLELNKPLNIFFNGLSFFNN
jgi:hypothetical protein